MTSTLLLSSLLLATPSLAAPRIAGPVLGQSAVRAADAVRRRAGPAASPSVTSAASTTATSGSLPYELAEVGRTSPSRLPVLTRGSRYRLRFPSVKDRDLHVEVQTPGSVLLLTAWEGPAGATLTGRTDHLVDGTPPGSKGFHTIRTNPRSADPQAFHAGMKEVAGAGGAFPHRDLGLLDATRPRSFGGREVLEGGGVLEVPFVATDLGRTITIRGVIPVAARASWLYFAGHYGSGGRGARLLGDQVLPSTIAGRGWRDHLDVLLFATCSAGKISSNVREGADWWRKFEGTFLAYRDSAPTKAAPRIARSFLERVGTSGISPSDRHAYSEVLARSWMLANAEAGNRMAVAFDSRGRFYLTISWSDGLDTSRARPSSLWAGVLQFLSNKLPAGATRRVDSRAYWVLERKDWERQVPSRAAD